MSHQLVKRIDLLLGLVPTPTVGGAHDRSWHPSSPTFHAPVDPPHRRHAEESTPSPFRAPAPRRVRRWTGPTGASSDDWSA